MTHLIDTHFHLDYYPNYKELYDNINCAEQYTLCMTNSPGIYNSCCRMLGESKYIKFAMGFHPKCKNLTIRDFNQFISMSYRADYFGEIGLDFSNSKKYLDKEKQLLYFGEIVKIASERNRLMSIHLKRSENYAIDIIEKYRPQKAIIHWFNGSKNQLKSLINLNCYFSINTSMLEKSTDLLELIPTDRLLVESDGPFTKVDGKKYYPQLLRASYNRISSALNIIDFESIVYQNFKGLLSV